MKNGTKKPSEEARKTLPILNFKELKEVPSATLWLIEKYIPERAVVLIVGKRSSFKTFLSLHVSHCLCTGKDFINNFKCQKVGVLYLDEENGADGLKDKFLMCTGNEDLENFYSCSFAGIKIDRGDWYERLENTLAAHPEIGVLIIDSFRRISSVDEDDAEQVSKILTEKIRPLTLKFGITIILLHHLRKGQSGRNPFDEMDEIRGSSDIANYSDVVLLLERGRYSNDRLVLKHLKSRNSLEMKPQNIGIRWEEKKVAFECLGSAEEIINEIERCAKQILVWLEENDVSSFKTKEVIIAMKGQGFLRRTVERSISEILIPQSKIRKMRKGLYERSEASLQDVINSQNTTNASLTELSD